MKKLLLLSAFIALHVCGLAQLPNADFEHWGTATSGRPYLLMWPQMESAWHYRDTVAQHGSYALSVSVWYYYTKTEAILETPVSTRPGALAGYYRYRENTLRYMGAEDVTDTARIQVWLSRWNAAMLARDTIGHGSLSLAGSSAYSYFECPVHYTSSDMPDTITLVFDPSVYIRESGYFCTDGYCSFLSIDNISLLETPTYAPAVAKTPPKIFPNPATNSLEISLPAPDPYRCTITNVAGVVVSEERLHRAHSTVSVSGLVPGAYVISVKNENDGTITRHSFIKR